MDTPSTAMWCATSTSTDSAGDSTRSRARHGTSVARSNTRPVSSATVPSRSVAATVSTRSTGRSAVTIWCGSPSVSRKTVRRVSCRSARSPSAAFRASTSTSPDRRMPMDTLYAAPAPASSRRLRNHIRCCAYDSGTRSGRSRGVSAMRAAPRPCSTSRARPATVGASKSSRMLISAASADRIRAMSRIASRESPPSSKNESSTPTRSSPRLSANSPHSTSSTVVSGPRPLVRLAKSGAGRAERSSLPFSVTGNASSGITAAGTMCPGSRPATNDRNSAGSRAAVPCSGTTYATRRRTPPSSRATTSARPTASCAFSTASISPGSTRKPRILICASARPANTNSPSAVHRTRSPVRYIRSPGPPRSPNGQATNRSAVSPARPAYPRARPRPATYNSPTTPGTTGRKNSSST
ncbi:hypothetical protein SFUMM280S_04920 [Streptomyces fumanus]